MTVQTVSSAVSMYVQSTTVSVSTNSSASFGKVMDSRLQASRTETSAGTAKASQQDANKAVANANASTKAEDAKSAQTKVTDTEVTKSAQEAADTEAAKSAQATAEAAQAKADAQAEAVKQAEAANQTAKTSETDSNATVDEFGQLVLSDELDNAEFPEDLLTKMIELLNQISQLIQNNFGISEGQLQESALQLGTQPLELASSETLQQLVLQFSDATAEQLLTDGELYGKLETLQAQVEQLLLENGITPELLNNENFATQLNQALLGGTVKVSSTTVEVKELVINLTELNAEQLTVLNQETKPVQTEGDTAEFDAMAAKAQSQDLKEVLMKESDAQSDAQAGNNASTFLQNLAAARANIVPEAAEAMHTFQDVYDIAGQLIEQVKLTVTADSTSMEMQLYPEHLGTVDLQITSKNGAMTAQLTTRNEVSKEAIESQLQVLRETLENQGIKVDAIEVTVSEFGFRQGEESAAGQQQQGSKGNRGFTAIDDTDLAEENFRDTVEVLKEMNGNSVDYVA